MAEKVIEVERVRKEVNDDGEFVAETYTETAKLKVCDLCDNDERGIDGEFKYHTTIGAEALAESKLPGDAIDDLLDSIYLTVELTNDANETTTRLFRQPIRQMQDSEYRAASRLPEQASAYNIVATAGPLPDTEDKPDNETNDATLLLCPHCHEGLFGDDQ